MDTLCNTVGLTSPAPEAKEEVVVAFVKRRIGMETKVVMTTMTVAPAFARGARPDGCGCEDGDGNG